MKCHHPRTDHLQLSVAYLEGGAVYFNLEQLREVQRARSMQRGFIQLKLYSLSYILKMKNCVSCLTYEYVYCNYYFVLVFIKIMKTFLSVFKLF